MNSSFVHSMEIGLTQLFCLKIKPQHRHLQCSSS